MLFWVKESLRQRCASHLGTKQTAPNNELEEEEATEAEELSHLHIQRIMLLENAPIYTVQEIKTH